MINSSAFSTATVTKPGYGYSSSSFDTMLGLFSQKKSSKWSSESSSRFSGKSDLYEVLSQVSDPSRSPPAQNHEKDELDRLVRDAPFGVKFLKNMVEIPLTQPPVNPLPVYSPKVFVGGLPPDCMNNHLYSSFSQYGDVEFLWPTTDRHGPRNNGGGYVFLIFSDEHSVNRLLANCRSNQEGYFKYLSLSQNRQVQVQIRPWLLSDGDYVPVPDAPIDSRLTVFVGGVPRTVRAVDIAQALSQFGTVAYAGIDVDGGHCYPKGAARISFTNARSYIHAMGSKIVTIVCKGETKTLQLKPYLLEEAECEECTGEQPVTKPGKYFCAEVSCLSYFCETCWQSVHFERHIVDRRLHPAYVRMGDQVKTVRVERPPSIRFDRSRYQDR